ncbi:MAG: hypothetical protein H7Y03_11975 [Chitinophagaceae bacterium]|nr:hypothetical protein [Chitinophagaceae bacterium]
MMEKESQYTSILSMINTLKKENESLTAKINKLSTGNSTITNEMLKNEKSRAALLEKRISDLNAELRFAKVDCNLTRADVTQIISNSKQRKELLAEALASLNNLSRSDDAVIAQKAKEKFQRLNNIAKTVRD